jgi:CHASE2 domain-containing sensor protein
MTPVIAPALSGMPDEALALLAAALSVAGAGLTEAGWWVPVVLASAATVTNPLASIAHARAAGINRSFIVCRHSQKFG